MERLPDLEATTTITLTADDYKKAWRKEVSKHARSTTVKGFRKGQVPTAMVIAKHGRKLLYQVATQLAHAAMEAHCEQEGVQLLHDPMVTLKAFPETLEENTLGAIVFTYEIGIAPSYVATLDKSIKVAVPQITQVAAEEGAQVLQRLRRSYGKSKDVSQAAVGHELYGTVQEHAEGPKVALSFVLTEKLASLQPHLVGTTAPAEHLLLAEVVAALSQDPILSKDTKGYLNRVAGSLSLTLQQIMEVTPAPLNQAFFDKAIGKGKVESEEACLAHLKELLRRNLQTHAHRRTRQAMREAVIAHVALPLPEGYLKRWLAHRHEGALSEEQLQSHYERHVAHLKWRLIADKLTKEAKITVPQEDAEQAFQQLIHKLAAQQATPGITPESLQLKIDHLVAEKGQRYYAQVYRDLLEERILDHVEQAITLEPQPMDSKAYAVTMEATT